MRYMKSKLKQTWLLVCSSRSLGAGLFMPQFEEALAQTTRPFAGLSGKWSGDDSIVLSNGTTERLRCDATYVESGGGDNLDQTLRCGSDSYKFDLRISLVDTAGAILGNWNEVEKGVQGGISGHQLEGPHPGDGERFESPPSTAATHGTEQSVKIRAQSGDLSQVTITLHHAR